MLNKPQTPANKRVGKGSLIVMVGLFLIVIFLWRDPSRIKADAQILIEQNEQLQQDLATIQLELAAVKSELKSTKSELNFFKTGHPEKAVEKQAKESATVKSKPIEVPETLFLQTPKVSQTTGGLTARLIFQSSGPEVPRLVTFVVRIPNHSSSIITEFKPADEARYANIRTRVNPGGKFAFFQGSPIDLNTLVFDLTVSEPATVTVRGSKGIKPFEIDIVPDAATIRKL